MTDNNLCTGEVVGSVTGAVAGSAADQFFQMMANGARDLLGTVSTFWMKVPSPEVASGSGQNWTGAESITSIQAWISPLAFVIFLVSLGLALVKIAHDTRRAGEGFNAIVRSLVTTLAGGLPILAIAMLGIAFGDEFAPWVLAQASGEDTSAGFEKVFVASLMGSSTPVASGGLLMIYLLAILGAIAQCFFMVVRGAAIIVLLSFAQVTAAGTATEEGWLRFKRICMLLVGFVLYKPVAAVVYGVGLKLMSDGATTGDQMMNAIYGLTIMVMAALALPALIKFVAPAAAMGSSSAFSGGAAVGAVATGAAVVALAGAGGGAAAASGSGASGAGAGGGWGGGDLGGSGSSNAPGAKDGPSASTGDNDGDSGASGAGSGSEAGVGDGGDPASESVGAGSAPAGGSSESGGKGSVGGGDGPAGAAPGGPSSSTSSTSSGGEDQPGSSGSSGTAGAQASPMPGQSASGSGGSSSEGDGGRARGDTSGSSGAQAGAQTVQNIAGQMNQAGDDVNRE